MQATDSLDSVSQMSNVPVPSPPEPRPPTFGRSQKHDNGLILDTYWTHIGHLPCAKYTMLNFYDEFHFS